MSCELFIKHGEQLMFPPVVDGVQWEWERQGQPGKLTFDVVKTKSLAFEEGDPCRFSIDGKPVFYGFVFDKSRSGSNPNVIKVTVYDQIYYLVKNKDTYVYSNKTATEVVKMIAEDFGLNLGNLENTGFKIPSRTEDSTSLIDIILNALDLTLKATSKLYVLYDNVGKLTLSNIANMRIGLIVDKDTIADYDYKSSIFENTYNRVKLVYEDSDSGERRVYLTQDSSTINQWGVLQYYEKLNDETNAKAMADALLSLYNTKTCTLKLKDALGDVRVRGGTMIVAMLDLGDTVLSNFMIVEQVKHTYKDNQHTMELKLRGGNFVT